MPSSQHVPSFLSSVAPRWALHCRPLDRCFPCPQGWQIPGSLGPSDPLSQPAHSSFPVRSSRLSREAWPHSPWALVGLVAFVQRPAFSSFLVIPPAVAPARLQPAPPNSLLVNW